MKNILIVDDDRDTCLLLKKFLNKKGYDATSTDSGESAMHSLRKHTADLVICDYWLPDGNGIETLKKIKSLDSHIGVIIITGQSDVRVAVKAMREGALDYVTKPLRPEELLETVNKAFVNGAKKSRPAENKKQDLRANGEGDSKFIAGVSHQSKEVNEHVALIAPTNMSVIISGETGTGKEYIAKAIHDQSERATGPFVAVDCGALSNELAASELFGHVKGAFTGAIADKKGCFELADGGTLFLDEIGNLDYENQIKLLRVLQERVVKKVGGTEDIPVDVRLLVATNEDLHHALQEGKFREDLYHRLNEFNISLAPLRERPDDIEVFARHFLDLANQQLTKSVRFDENVMRRLKSYRWHGNLRELRNTVKRAVLMCQGDVVDEDCLPDDVQGAERANVMPTGNMHTNGTEPVSLKDVVLQAERIAIMNTLEETNYNKVKAAKLLKVDRKTLYNKLKAQDCEV